MTISNKIFSYLKKKELIFLLFFPSIIIFSFYTGISDSFLLPRKMVVSVIVLFYFLISNKKEKQYFNFANFVFLVLGIISLVSIFYTINIAETINAASEYFFMFVLLLFVQSISDTIEKRNQIIKGLLVVNFFLIFAIGFQLIFNQKIDLQNVDSLFYLVSPLGHKNISSAGLVLLIPFSVFAVIKFEQKLKYSAILSILLSVLIIILLQARSSYLAIITFFIVFLFGYIIYRYKSLLFSKKQFFIFLISLIFLFSFIILNPFQSNFIDLLKSRFLSIFSISQNLSEENKTIHERLFLWNGSIEMIKENFISGIGAGNWKIFFPFEGLEHSRAAQGSTIFQRPHNDFIWVFSEIGVLSFILYLSIFVTSIYSNIKHLFVNNKEQFINSLVSISGIMSYFVIANFSFPKEKIFLSFLLVCFLVLFKNKNQRIKSTFSIHKFFIYISIFFVIVVSFVRFKGELFLFKAQENIVKNQWELVVKNINISKSFLFNLSNTATPIDWYKGVAFSNLKDYKKAKKSFEIAFKNNPSHLQTINNLASTYEILGEHQLAFNTYDSALIVSPLFYDALINISSISINEQKLETAFNYLARVNLKKDNLDERYYTILDFLLKKIIIQLYNNKEINELSKNNFLNNKNYLVNTYLQSGPAYWNFIKEIKKKSFEFK